jgi:hypothetical protein
MQYKYTVKLKKMRDPQTDYYVLIEEVRNGISKNPVYVSWYYFDHLVQVRKFYREVSDARKKAEGKKGSVSIYSEEL